MVTSSSCLCSLKMMYVLVASLVLHLELSLDRFAAECEAARMRISTSKSDTVVLSWTIGGVPSTGRGEDPAPGGRVQIPQGLVHEWEVDRWICALDLKESVTCVISCLLFCCFRLFPEMLKAWDGCQKYFYRSWARRTALQSALQHASKVPQDPHFCLNIRTRVVPHLLQVLSSGKKPAVNKIHEIVDL